MHNRKWEGEKEEEKRLMGKQLENTTTAKTNALEDSWGGAVCQPRVSNQVSQTAYKSTVLFKLILWDSHFLQPSPAQWILATEADILGLRITQPIAAMNLADHESSVEPRHVAWEVVKKQRGCCEGRNGNNLVTALLFSFTFNHYVQGPRVLHTVGWSFIWNIKPGADKLSQ